MADHPTSDDRVAWAIGKVMSGQVLTPEDCASLSIKEALEVSRALTDLSRSIRTGAADAR